MSGQGQSVSGSTSLTLAARLGIVPATGTNALTVVFGVVAGVVAVGSVVGLGVNPGAEWLSPIIVGCLGVLGAISQAASDRQHAEKLARITEELQRNSMQYERKLDAFAAVAQAMRGLIENAAAIVRGVDGNSGTPGELPTIWFHRGSNDDVQAFWRHSAVLRVVADVETTRILDLFAAALDDLDEDSIRDQSYGGDEALHENDAHLRDALKEFRPAYEAFLAHAKEELARHGG